VKVNVKNCSSYTCQWRPAVSHASKTAKIIKSDDLSSTYSQCLYLLLVFRHVWTVDCWHLLACHVPYIAFTFTRLLYANYYANRNRVVSMFSDTSNWILKLPKFVLLRHGVSPVSVCMRRRNSLAPPASTCNHRHPTVPSPNRRCHCTVPRLGDLRLRTASLASLGRPTAADKLPRHVAVLRRRTRQVRAELIGACAVETPQRPGRDLSTPR